VVESLTSVEEMSGWKAVVTELVMTDEGSVDRRRDSQHFVGRGDANPDLG
jgi:hypothetical protein